MRSSKTVLEALEAAGLDIVVFGSWCQRRGYEIREESLKRYFMDKEKALESYFGPYGVSYFMHMGVMESHCKTISERFWRLFNAIEWGVRPVDFLQGYYGSVARGPIFHDPELEPWVEEQAALAASDHYRQGILALQTAVPGQIIQIWNNHAHRLEPVTVLKSLGESGKDLYFHGTSLGDAVEILMTCPTVFKAEVQSDFNGGFYLSEKESLGRQWALKRAVQTQCAEDTQLTMGVVLVYSLKGEFWDQLSILSLAEHPSNWEKLCFGFRNGDLKGLDLMEFYTYDVITGPMVRNPRSRQENWVPEPFEVQYNIVSPKVARSLRYNLVGVLQVPLEGLFV